MFPRAVFAHYMVGLTLNQTVSQWQHDIISAKNASIDGFALNIGPGDHFTLDELHDAYSVAAEVGNFSLFLSFDFAAAGGPAGHAWNVSSVAGLIGEFKGEDAQYLVDGKPLVSTFEGTAFVDDWDAVRKEVDGGIYFVPDWSSMGPEGVGRVRDRIDGHFSFDAWPKPGQQSMTTVVDKAYQAALDGKTYMMGVSPYFYTNLHGLSKNWYATSTTLWYDRLEQMLSLEPAPDMVQIISWNDFGESHYISDIVHTQVYPDAGHYIHGMDHSAFRTLLPYYIAAYKSGKKSIPLLDDMGDGIAVAWYRTTPNLGHCGDGGAVWGQGGTQSAKEGLEDSINVVVITGKKKAVLTVSVGGEKREFVVSRRRRELVKVMLSEFKGLGEVKIGLNGREEEGPPITEVCPETGALNLNVVAVDVVAPWTEGGEEEEDGDEDVQEEGGGGGSGPGSSTGGSGGNTSGGLEIGTPSWAAVLSVVAFHFSWAIFDRLDQLYQKPGNSRHLRYE
ncbi:glycoside hydrolase [Podospora aff. communis PSN243]|uniref:Glycoside hydrolase n=1 Tax=Podospora aff. communis PSN243 TaxID=3040156 RepID=A0AAV9G393_9PEZI|nr:glycoside hydrolase [Podospora aff. communis PSN243]